MYFRFAIDSTNITPAVWQYIARTMKITVPMTGLLCFMERIPGIYLNGIVI